MEITKKFQNNAKVIKVTKKELTVPNIEQYYYDVKPKKKEEVLSRLLDIYSPRLSVVFCNTKKAGRSSGKCTSRTRIFCGRTFTEI